MMIKQKKIFHMANKTATKQEKRDAIMNYYKNLLK